MTDDKSNQTDPLQSYRLKTDIQPRFSDVDAFGIVNNARFFTYFEEARVTYVKTLGIFMPQASDPVSFVIQQAECSYQTPILHQDRVEVYVRTSDWGRSQFMFHYAVWLPQRKTLAAQGSTRAVSYDFKSRRPVPIPEEFLLKMKSFEAGA